MNRPMPPRSLGWVEGRHATVKELKDIADLSNRRGLDREFAENFSGSSVLLFGTQIIGASHLWRYTVKLRGAINAAVERGVVSESAARRIGRDVKDYVKESLRPISRTGDTIKSIQANYRVTGQNAEITIFSNHYERIQKIYSGNFKRYISGGDYYDGPIDQDLYDWVQTKNIKFGDFARDSDGRLVDFQTFQSRKRHFTNITRRIALAILRNDSPGQNSDIRKLPPVGERSFDLFGETVKKVRQTLYRYYQDNIVNEIVNNIS